MALRYVTQEDVLVTSWSDCVVVTTADKRSINAIFTLQKDSCVNEATTSKVKGANFENLQQNNEGKSLNSAILLLQVKFSAQDMP